MLHINIRIQTASLSDPFITKGFDGGQANIFEKLQNAFNAFRVYLILEKEEAEEEV